MRAAAAVALVFFLATSGNAQLRNYRAKNGVRLVGGTGGTGRIELSSVNSWFNNYSQPIIRPAWNAVCDSSFDDGLALIMCTMLGYSYGRKAYDSKFNYRKTSSWDPPIGRIVCNANTPAAVKPRHLLGVQDPENAASLLSAVDDDVSPDRRSLYEPLTGDLNAPSKAPYKCKMFSGACANSAPMAGIECSHTPMPAAPPPPPSPPVPPVPPPAPPPASASIKIVGGRPIDLPELKVEPNLWCEGEEPSCDGFGRVEILVPAPGAGASGAKIWAPICSIDDPTLAFSVRYVACQQMMDWPGARSGVVIMTTEQNVNVLVPEGRVNATGLFDAAGYSGWATVVAPGSSGSILRVQDFNVTVSATKCKKMLAVTCQVFGLPGL